MPIFCHTMRGTRHTLQIGLVAGLISVQQAHAHPSFCGGAAVGVSFFLGTRHTLQSELVTGLISVQQAHAHPSFCGGGGVVVAGSCFFVSVEVLVPAGGTPKKKPPPVALDSAVNWGTIKADTELVSSFEELFSFSPSFALETSGEPFFSPSLLVAFAASLLFVDS